MGTDAWLGTQLETNKTCMVDVPEFDMNSLNMSKHVYLNFKGQIMKEPHCLFVAVSSLSGNDVERSGTLSKVKTAKSHGLGRIVID